MRIGVRTFFTGKTADFAAAGLDRAIRSVPLLAGVLLAAWAGGELAALLAPATHGRRPLPVAAPAENAGTVAAAHWFGTEPVAAAEAPPPLSVIGVFAPMGDGKDGFAIVDENGHAAPLLQGKTTSGGWKLARVEASGIVLVQGAQERFVPLVARGGQAPQGAGPDMLAQQPPLSPPSMAPRQPPAFAPSPGRDMPADQAPGDPAPQK
ncbi:hypothetical protein [Paludibacterium paludis]|uniref:Type II secretion system protein GspC N-terminal domain-containing protein n=1 Tax=Paludibacterium paludis TaxID=1225769 RepID=A0A918NZE2_9NEIS|nr:hypothetical protein [Paludibacterium paludis]GGY08147.1 hypothetical protein GCM10011289_08490 [Paludibacterium paludis]